MPTINVQRDLLFEALGKVYSEYIKVYRVACGYKYYFWYERARLLVWVPALHKRGAEVASYEGAGTQTTHLLLVLNVSTYM